MTISPPLALFEDDYDVEMGVYVVSQEKLKEFLKNRAGSVATSQAAHAIANLTASGGGSEEDRMQDDQGPQFEGKPIFLMAAATQRTGAGQACRGRACAVVPPEPYAGHTAHKDHAVVCGIDYAV
jgi:hypothetical protein